LLSPPRKQRLGVYRNHPVRPSVRPSAGAIKKDLRGKYMVCPRHMSYFEIMEVKVFI
jgi:hypothetical protein